MNKPMHKQQGLTLIELMVALVISLLILAGLLTIYQSNNRAYRISDSLVRVQENGRFAMDFLVRDLRMAGFPAEGKVHNQVAGTEGGGNAPDQLTVLNQTGTDCVGTVIGAAGADGPVVTNTYRIIDTGRVNRQGNAIMALECNGQELVEGIENMQILYGIDTNPGKNRDGVADRYVTANNVPNWSRVVSVRIALLANSVDELASAPSARTFRMLGTNLGPFNDNMIRREYSSTVALMNYLFDRQ